MNSRRVLEEFWKSFVPFERISRNRAHGKHSPEFGWQSPEHSQSSERPHGGTLANRSIDNRQIRNNESETESARRTARRTVIIESDQLPKIRFQTDFYGESVRTPNLGCSVQCVSLFRLQNY